jgi:hypothetical protein
VDEKSLKALEIAPANKEFCFSTTALLARGNLSFDFTLLIDNVHFLSSSDKGPVQSRVVPPFDEVGTGCIGVIAVDGLKSISELLLVFSAW